MSNKALVVIDIQNDITKHYKEIIGNINGAVDWAAAHNVPVVYIRHFNLSAGTRNFKPDTPGAELAPDLNIASENIFDKSKSNALTSEAFASYLAENGIKELFVCGADATICVKSTCFNLRKAGYEVAVLSDCITSWDKKKLPEMIAYYEKQGCRVIASADMQSE
ncbi:MAG: cysteine hydrolase [Rickettsiales bacterium]|nr:cysteine hydrolase [Rickettsiales bacterium]